MSDAIDTSVLVAAIVGTEAFHDECLDLILRHGTRAPLHLYLHGITETFSTLTGGRRSIQMSANMATDIIENDFSPKLTVTTLTPSEMLRAMRDAQARGVRGGGVFDYLHLVAARKAKARRIHTLNISNFRAFHRAGDPEIVHPGKPR